VGKPSRHLIFEPEQQMKLKAKVTIVTEEFEYAPGEVLLVKDKKEAQSLIDRGFAEQTSEPVTAKGKAEADKAE
jgi:hypothetical protein